MRVSELLPDPPWPPPPLPPRPPLPKLKLSPVVPKEIICAGAFVVVGDDDELIRRDRANA